MAEQGEREREHRARRAPLPAPSTIYRLKRDASGRARGNDIVWSGDWRRGKGSATARRLWSQMIEASGVLTA